MLNGQFRFPENVAESRYKPLTLRACGPAGAWKRVYTADQYPRLVFKLCPASEDVSYTVEEIRTFTEQFRISLHNSCKNSDVLFPFSNLEQKVNLFVDKPINLCFIFWSANALFL